MKRIIAILLMLLMLCGCGSNVGINGDLTHDEDLTPVKGGEIRLFSDVPDTLNPIVTGYKSISEIMYLVYDGLFRTENDFSATPVLSSGYTANAGNTQYVVRLKKGVKFHDGSRFGAEDVIATLDVISRTDSKYNNILVNVESYFAQDDGSVVFNLKTAQSNFVNLLDFPVMPSELGINDYAIENVFFTPNGTGKYKVDRIDADTLTLVKFDDYHGEKPYVDKVAVSYLKDNSVAKYSFEALEFDVITTGLYSWGDTSMSGDFSTVEYESNRLTFLGMNCANLALSDKAVRKAISIATDKFEIISEIMFTHAAMVSSPVNPNAFFANNEYVHATYETGKAKEEFKSAGWLDLDGDGILDKFFGDQQFSLSFLLIVNADNDVSVRLAEYLAQHYAEEGIHIEIASLSYDMYISALQNGEFDMFIGRTDIANDCDIGYLLQTGGMQNYLRYSSAGMDSAIYDIRTANGTHGIKTAYSNFDTVFKNECPFIPLYFETDAVFSSVRVKGGMNISRTGVFTGLQNAFVKYKD